MGAEFDNLQHDSQGLEGVARNTSDYSISAYPQAEIGAFCATLTCALGAGRSEDMSLPAPLAAIDVLLAEKRKARGILDADISALERSRELLAGVLLPQQVPESVVANAQSAGTSDASPAPVAIAPGAWHDAALAVFNDGRTHTTAEVFEAAKMLVGPELGYSAVASWLNRMAERGTLHKDGRGEFRRPSPQPRVKTSEEEALIVA